MNDSVEVINVAARSPHNEGLYEAGKAMLIASVEVGRDFCKSMIGVATGAIPVYVTLLALVLGKGFRPSVPQGAVLTLAPVTYLFAVIAFAIGYFPITSTFSLDVPTEIEQARVATVRKRVICSYLGLGLLVLGVALSIASIYYSLSLAQHH